MNTTREQYLIHYGVKKMKWYQRRWQNYDGSLTPAGYIHYGYGSARSKAAAGNASGGSKLARAKSGADLDGNSVSTSSRIGWGARRYQNADGSLTEAGKSKYAKNSYGMTGKEQKKLANKLKGAGENSYTNATQKALSDKNVQKAIDNYREKVADLNSKSPWSYMDKFDELSDDKIKTYYRKPLEEEIKRHLENGWLDAEKDKDYIQATYDLKTDLALESENVREEAFQSWLKDNKLMKEYEKSVKDQKERYDIAEELAKELLGKFGDEDIGKSPYKWVKNATPVELRLTTIIRDYGDKHDVYGNPV